MQIYVGNELKLSMVIDKYRYTIYTPSQVPLTLLNPAPQTQV